MHMIERESFTECSACGSGNLKEICALPKFPHIGVYLKDRGRENAFPEIDNALTYCTACGHVQLGFAIDQKFLYSPDFQHKTSQSASARQANEFLFGFVKKVVAGRRLKHVVEIGCNDTFLLQMLESVSDRLFGLDPILAGKEKEFLGSVSEASRHKYGIIGNFIENVDFKSEIGSSPDLVVSNFVFEHIKSPRRVLEKAFQRVSDDTIFVIGVPGTEFVVDNGRFDQLSHQHYQQFTVESYHSMLNRLGAKIIDTTVNYTNWGQIVVAFSRGDGKPRDIAKPRYTFDEICASKERFHGSLEIFKQSLRVSGKTRKVYGFGAAQNFPILDYFAGGFEDFRVILDDHPMRQDTFYPRLPYSIEKPMERHEGCAAAITGPDYGRALVRRTNELGFEQIIMPFGVV